MVVAVKVLEEGKRWWWWWWIGREAAADVVVVLLQQQQLRRGAAGEVCAACVGRRCFSQLEGIDIISLRCTLLNVISMHANNANGGVNPHTAALIVRPTRIRMASRMSKSGHPCSHRHCHPAQHTLRCSACLLTSPALADPAAFSLLSRHPARSSRPGCQSTVAEEHNVRVALCEHPGRATRPHNTPSHSHTTPSHLLAAPRATRSPHPSARAAPTATARLVVIIRL